MGEILRPLGPLACVVGARPNYMKMAPLVRAFGARRGLPGVVLIHTGQHYDLAMNERLFADLGMPAPPLVLAVALGIAFRDRPVDFPVYDRGRFDSTFLDSLGPIAQPRREQAPSNVAPIPTRPRMIG